MPQGPNVSGMVNDPQFQGLPPVQQREALFKLTNDQAFSNLSDGDTMQFVSKMRTPPQGAQATGTISQAPTGVGPWLQNLESDVKFGGGTTLPGRLLQKLGAPGLERGVSPETAETVGSPVLGPIHTAQGVAETPQHPLAGILKTAGGLAQTATIPGGFVGPEAAGAAINNIPSKAMGAQLLEETAQEANKLPVTLTRTLPQLQELKSYVDAAGQTPRGMGKFFKRIQTLTDNPMNYEEARKFYQNVSRLTAEDQIRLTRPIQRQMAQVAQAFKADIGDTAAQVGKQAQYYEGLAQYAKAAKLREMAIKVAKYVGIPMTTGAAAAAGYESTKKFLK